MSEILTASPQYELRIVLNPPSNLVENGYLEKSKYRNILFWESK